MPTIDETVCNWCTNRPLTMTDMIGIFFSFFKYIHNDVKFVGKTASWLVILASVNLCFPDFLRKMRDGESLRTPLLRFLSYLYPFVIHSVFWTQFVHMQTFCFNVFGLSEDTAMQWTIFISGLCALAYCYFSLWLTGIVEGPPFPWDGRGRFTRPGQGTVCTRLRLDTGLQLECCMENGPVSSYLTQYLQDSEKNPTLKPKRKGKKCANKPNRLSKRRYVNPAEDCSTETSFGVSDDDEDLLDSPSLDEFKTPCHKESDCDSLCDR